MGKKILIIDDDQVIVKYLKKFLTDNGYEAISASDGREGMETAQNTRPALILLDVMMETLCSGFEVLRKLKLDPDLKGIPVIGVSGMKDEIDVRFDPKRDAEYFSPDAFLEKPVDKDLLLKTIQCLIEK
jgi:twitching motility two-component system response regulator PilH